MIDSATARRLAECQLSEALPRRWSHVSAVAARAESIAGTPGVDAEALISAAWLHDIGYAPELADTGFHPLDGARYLRAQGVDGRILGLVAYHSCARIEADERGLVEELSEFAYEDSATADALCYCDMTTGPDGERIAIRDRLDEIRRRYRPADLVTRFINRAEPELVAAAERTEVLLHRPGATPPM